VPVLNTVVNAVVVLYAVVVPNCVVYAEVVVLLVPVLNTVVNAVVVL
jgi:hypothetical protein